MRKVIGWILLGVGLVARPALSQDLSNGDSSVPAVLLTAQFFTYQSAALPDVSPQQPGLHPVAIDYGHGYELRGKIHKYASFPMLPLFGADFVIGQSLRSELVNGEESNHAQRDAHIALGTAIYGLFGVNTVTGVWNLVQARHDPNQRTLRLVHGLLMLGADAGFVATTMTAPSGIRNGSSGRRNPAHRPLAVASMSVATASYLMMLIADR